MSQKNPKQVYENLMKKIGDLVKEAEQELAQHSPESVDKIQ